MGRKILVIRMDHLGDVMLTTPLVRALALAGDEVQVVVPRAFVPVFDNSPHVIAALAMDGICPDFPRDWRRLADWILAQGFDAVLLPYAVQKHLLWASFFSGAKIRVAMWAGLWGRLTGHRCLPSRIKEEPRYFAEIVLDCARALGVAPQGTAPEFFLTEGERGGAKVCLAQRFGERRVIGIHPGCAGNACNLPSLAYAQVAEALLQETDCAIVVTGSAKERELLRSWPPEVVSSPRVWIAMGEMGLRELAANIGQFAVYVCPSTGPLHIASALSIPTVSPFCSLRTLAPVVWGNQRANAVALMPAEESCRLRRQQNPGHCDFCGQVSVASIIQAVLRSYSR
jgi:ADP-heptose:LPS heptosyltransferase